MARGNGFARMGTGEIAFHHSLRVPRDARVGRPRGAAGAKRRALAAWLSLAAIALPAPGLATWSIVLTDTRTHEVAIGSATCVTGIDLLAESPVVMVERGAGTAQGIIDATGHNRALIRQGLAEGTDPANVLQLLDAQDRRHQWRQYVLGDTRGRVAAFTGTRAGAFAGDVSGRVGTVRYAIAGNLLTGPTVLSEAEQAIVNSTADLPTRLMLAMLAAREQGGDGRCACSPFAPDGCGAPPAGFAKAAHVGYMVAARAGDTDGSCASAPEGCANGDYYMHLNVGRQETEDLDPVVQLLDRFLLFRARLTAVPDHHRSLVLLSRSTLPADGTSQAIGFIVVRDVRGKRIRTPGLTLSLSADAQTSPDSVHIEQPTELAPGVFRFALGAGDTPGTVTLEVRIEHTDREVTLAPRPTITVIAPGAGD